MILYAANFEGTIPRLRPVDVMSLKIGEAVFINGARHIFIRKNTSLSHPLVVEMLVAMSEEPRYERWYLVHHKTKALKIIGYHLRQRKAA
ncbi:hypothetical protein [Pantoea phage Nafs113]|nr:hypothetical protein [Pantoea phage Nafs113]